MGDVFSQLVDANFLSGGQLYTGILKQSERHKESSQLNNDKTIGENGFENNDTIQVLIATQAGGFDIVQLWQELYPYFDQIGTVVGIAGATIGLGGWIKNKFSKKYTPKQFTEIITDKELWTAHELALHLNITDEESKNFLKGFGYKWDKRYSLYYKTAKTVEIIKNIQTSNNDI